MPGARPKGALAYSAISSVPAADARQVASMTVPLSMPAAAMICGLTKMIYAIVTKDVIPPDRLALPGSLALLKFKKLCYKIIH